MSDIYQKLGQNVRKYRERAKLTQDRLCDTADISQYYLSQIENGRRKPTLDILNKIAEALNIQIFQLLKF
jgi:transcriptional regulator with XRE-family HTH domain